MATFEEQMKALAVRELGVKKEDATDDDTLRELYRQRSSLEAQIRARELSVARERGRVVTSISDLTCGKHQGATFKAIGTIPGSYSPTKLNVYQCEPCGKDNKERVKSTAYDCPDCGIVVGNYEKRHYRSSEGSWHALAGREGHHYHCTVCGGQLGSHYWIVS